MRNAFRTRRVPIGTLLKGGFCAQVGYNEAYEVLKQACGGAPSCLPTTRTKKTT